MPDSQSMLLAVQQVGTLFSMALRIALPVITTLMLVSLTLGIVGRTVPQLNILVLGFPIKILVGIFVISVSVPLFGESIADTLRTLPERVQEVVWIAPVGR